MNNLFTRVTSGGLRRVVTGVLASCALLGSALAAPVGTGEFLGMEVSLSLSKTELQVGEPLYLNLHVFNKMASLRVGNFGARLFLSEGNDIQVMVQAPGELPKRYSGGEPPGVYQGVEVDLNNGESMDMAFPMIYEESSPNGYLFSKPGVYRVSAKIRGIILRDPEPLVVELPPTEVVVRAPEGENAQAFDLIDEPKIAKALQIYLSEDPSVFQSVRQLVSKFPNSVYAPQCQLLSGFGYYRQQPPQFEKAAGEFRQFLHQHSGHPMAPEAAFMMVVTWAEAGNLDQARDWYFFLRDAYPTYHLLHQKNYYTDLFYTVPAESAGGRPWWMYERPWIVPGAHDTAVAKQRGEQ